MTDGNEAMSTEFRRKMAVKQEIYSQMREEKQQDIMKHGESLKGILTIHAFSGGKL